MLFECFWGSERKSILRVFPAWPLPLYPTPPNRSYGAAYMDRYVQLFLQTSPHSPTLWNQERFGPGHRFGNSQPPHLFPSRRPNYQTNPHNHHNSPINHPLRVAGHITARQHIDSLQEKGASRQNEHYASDVQNCFHLSFVIVCMIIHSGNLSSCRCPGTEIEQ